MSRQPTFDKQLEDTRTGETNANPSIKSNKPTEPLLEKQLRPRNTQRYKVHRGQKQNDSFRSLCTWVLENQIGLVANLLILLSLTHLCFPRLRSFTKLFFSLAYYNPSSQSYGRGRDDLYHVVFWVLIFTGIRALAMQQILSPFARWAGIRKEKARVRFSEQAWLLIYYTCSWSVGVYIASNSNYWLAPRELWSEFPQLQISGLVKRYFLVQYAFWLQQIFVVNIEERRKDHWQMLAHHIIACSLIFTSYGYYQAKAGNAILCIMDGVDILLALAKSLKYLGFQKTCDIVFGLFIVSWFIFRHVVFLIICWSIHKDAPEVVPAACFSPVDGSVVIEDGGSAIFKNLFQPFLDPDGLICNNERIPPIFLALLLMLQVITIIWFGMILRVAYRVLSGQGGAEDLRSEDECEDDIQDLPLKPSGNLQGSSSEQSCVQEVPLIEEEADMETLHFTRHNNPKRQYRKPCGRATGISISGTGDKKELLGRIGCDKPS